MSRRPAPIGMTDERHALVADQRLDGKYDRVYLTADEVDMCRDIGIPLQQYARGCRDNTLNVVMRFYGTPMHDPLIDDLVGMEVA